MTVNADTIIQSTGEVYCLPGADDPYGTTARQATNLVNPRFFGEGTGTEFINVMHVGISNHRLNLCNLASNPPLAGLVPVATGLQGLVISLVFKGGIDNEETPRWFAVFDEAIECLPTVSSVPQLVLDAPTTRASRSARPREQFPVSSEASRLRDLAGLDPNALADIFGVSRQAYHGWQTGIAPMPGHRRHLLEVLSMIEEAVRRLGNVRAVGAWLLTPAVESGKRPADYLRARDYDIFRGMLLRAGTRSEFAQPLIPGKRVARELPVAHREATRRRLRPSTTVERDD